VTGVSTETSFKSIPITLGDFLNIYFGGKNKDRPPIGLSLRSNILGVYYI